MILRSTFALFLLIILLIHTLNAINPEYFRRPQQDEQLSSLIDTISKQLNDQHSNSDLSEKQEDDDDDNNSEDVDQFIKRNKYPNFHVSPLWLSRRTRTNRFYGKPLWISRQG